MASGYQAAKRVPRRAWQSGRPPARSQERGLQKSWGGPEAQSPGHLLPLSRSPAAAQPGHTDGAQRKSRPDSTGALGQEVKGRPPSRDVALEVACCSLRPWHVGTECLLSAGHWAWRRGHRESEPGGGPTIAGQS